MQLCQDKPFRKHQRLKSHLANVLQCERVSFGHLKSKLSSIIPAVLLVLRYNSPVFGFMHILTCTTIAILIKGHQQPLKPLQYSYIFMQVNYQSVVCLILTHEINNRTFICLAISTINTTTMVVGLKLLKANIYFKFNFAVSQKFRMPVAVFTCIVGSSFVVTSTECIYTTTNSRCECSYLHSPLGVFTRQTAFTSWSRLSRDYILLTICNF